MGRLYIPAQNEVDGPWLLGHEKLESLNSLFKEIDNKLKEALSKNIENTAKQQVEEEGQAIDFNKRITKLQRKYNQKIKFAEITFEDGTTYKADDIEGILQYVDSNNTLVPIELYLRTTYGNHENEFDLFIDTKPADKEPEFEYRIKCIDEEVQQKIKSTIDKWVRENKSHRILFIWSHVIIYLIWFFGGLICFFSLISLADSSETVESYKEHLKHDARNMVNRGISKSNLDSALTIILKLESDYLPSIRNKSTEHNSTAWKFFIISGSLLLVSLIRPKTIIGIGRKYSRLQLYKVWNKAIWWIVGTILAILIADWYNKFIHW